MAFTYEDLIPSLIPNTTMQKSLLDGVLRAYRITPNEGYVLHDKARDIDEFNPETNEREFYLGYTRSTVSCGFNYDFSPVEVVDENGVIRTGYGALRELFAIPESEVPADHIFGITDRPEIM
jgi:hypothetical protein